MPGSDGKEVNALRSLEYLAQAERPCEVSDLVKALGLGKSSVYRPLSTLMRLGYVNQDVETDRYAATLRLWEVGSCTRAWTSGAAAPMTELAGIDGPM